MATIYDPNNPYESSASSDKKSYLGQIQWSTDTNDNLIEPNASGVAYDLMQKGYEVKYYHTAESGPERKTNYTLKCDEAEVGIPEKVMQDWEDAVRQVNGAKSLYFEPDRPVYTA